MPRDKSQKKSAAVGHKRVKRIQPMPLEGLVVLEQILLHYPVGKTTLYKEIKEGAFPAQKIKRGRSVFWDAVEVRQFLSSIGANIEVPCDKKDSLKEMEV